MSGKIEQNIKVKKIDKNGNAYYYTIRVYCNIDAGYGNVGAYGTSQWDSNWFGRDTTSPAWYEKTDELAIEVRDVSGYTIDHITNVSSVTNIRGPYSMSGGKYWRYNIISNAEIQVFYTRSTTRYTISTSSSPSAGGTTSGGGTFDAGSSCTVRAAAASGYTFVRWTENGSQVSTSANYTFTVNKNRSLVAVFERQPHNVNTSVYPSGAGTTTGGGSYYSGDRVTLSATPNTGYEFNYWVIEESYYDTPTVTFTMGSTNVTATAYFTRKPTHNVNTSVYPEEGGTTTGGGSYYSGDRVTLTATPNTYYEFNYWVIEESYYRTPTVSFTMGSSDVTATAYFTRKTPHNVNTSVYPEGGGTTTGGGSYYSGDSVTLIATPIGEYEFNYWVIEEGYYDTPTVTFTMGSSGVNAVAYFRKDKFYIALECVLTNGEYYETAEGVISVENTHKYDQLWYGAKPITERVYKSTEVTYKLLVSKTRGANAVSVVGLSYIESIEGPFEEGANKYWLFKIRRPYPKLQINYEPERQVQLWLESVPEGIGTLQQKLHTDPITEFKTLEPGYYIPGDEVDIQYIGDDTSTFRFLYWDLGHNPSERITVTMGILGQTIKAILTSKKHFQVIFEYWNIEGEEVSVTFEPNFFDTPTTRTGPNTYDTYEQAHFFLRPVINTPGWYFDGWGITNTTGDFHTSSELVLSEFLGNVPEHYQEGRYIYTMYLTKGIQQYTLNVSINPGSWAGTGLKANIWVRITDRQGRTTSHQVTEPSWSTWIETGYRVSFQQPGYGELEDRSIIAFKKWNCNYNNSVGDDDDEYFIIEEVVKDITMTAIFDYGVIFELWATPSNAGTVSVADPAKHLTGNKYTIAPGSILAISATSNEGYTFKYWELDGRYKAYNSIYIEGNYDSTKFTKFNAIYESSDPNLYSVICNIYPSQAGTVSGTGLYHLGDTVTLEATANKGWIFDHWDTGETSLSITFTVQGNILHSAYFRKYNYTDLIQWITAIKKRKRHIIVLK